MNSVIHSLGGVHPVCSRRRTDPARASGIFCQQTADFIGSDGFVEIIIYHANRAGAAGGEALGELDAVMAIRAD